MSRVKELAAKVAECENLNFNDKKNDYMFEVVYPKAQYELVEEANNDFTAAWDVFRNGTNEEFCGLINLISCGMNENEFSSDKSLNELMKIGKKRLYNSNNSEEFLSALKVGFGSLFEQFWNETEPAAEAIVQPRTFDKIMQKHDAAQV